MRLAAMMAILTLLALVGCAASTSDSLEKNALDQQQPCAQGTDCDQDPDRERTQDQDPGADQDRDRDGGGDGAGGGEGR